MKTTPSTPAAQFEALPARPEALTPTAYAQQAVALCVARKPVAQKVWDEHWHEFTYLGWRVGLHFAHRLKLVRTGTSDWISIGLADPHHLPPFRDHWKWNIHYLEVEYPLFSGPVAGVRFELLRELERRLARLAAHFNHE